jgi:hypothetical protein
LAIGRLCWHERTRRPRQRAAIEKEEKMADFFIQKMALGIFAKSLFGRFDTPPLSNEPTLGWVANK